MRGYGREPRDFFRPRLSERHFLWCMVALFVVGLALLAVVPDDGPHDWSVREAERHAIAKLHHIEAACGGHAEAWAEANSSMPHGFEIIGQCNG